MVKSIDKEMVQFQEDLLASVRQMKAGKAARTTVVALTPAAEARSKVGVSQMEFATLLGVSVRTLQDKAGAPLQALPRHYFVLPRNRLRPSDSRSDESVGPSVPMSGIWRSIYTSVDPLQLSKRLQNLEIDAWSSNDRFFISDCKLNVSNIF
jgi:hypothetical protein